MKLILAIVGIAFVAPAFAQRQGSQNCYTPERYYGTCVPLARCPQVANIFQTTNRRVAQEYVIGLQRSCGTRNIGGDPVVCCTRPQRPIAPVTSAPNPFLPQTPPNNNGQNPFLPPTPDTTPSTTTTSTTTSAPLPVPSPLQIETRGKVCRGPDFREGYCVDIRNCDELVTELYSKQNDQQFGNYLRASNVICGSTGSMVCCPSNDQVTSTAATVRIKNSNEVPRRLPTVEEGCGYTTIFFKKIVGGEVSKKGAWPWIALLGYDVPSGSPFKCGGTLVTARHVITAAHCLIRGLNFVRLGEHDLSTDAEAHHVDINVVKQEAHPEYNKRNGRSDLAILYLERNVDFTDFISPVCMPTTPQLRTKSYVSYVPFVVGWGKTMEGGASANVLQELQIPVYSNEVCRDRYYKQNRVFSADQFDDAVICAGVLSGGHDTCQGDSGGPLMIPEAYKDNVRYYLIGVVSYGIGCARPEVPGVYTSTQHFMDWIEEKVANTP